MKHKEARERYILAALCHILGKQAAAGNNENINGLIRSCTVHFIKFQMFKDCLSEIIKP